VQFDERDAARTRGRSPAREAADERREAPLHDGVLRLQRLLGNTAVTALISRTELQRDAAPAKPPPQEKKEGGGATYTLTVSDVGTFELLSFSWGASQSGAGGGGTGPGKHETKDVVCTKYADKHSAKLQQYVAEGRPIAEVTLVVKSGDGSVTFRFKNVHITSYQTGGSTGDVKPIETFSFEAASMEFEHSGGGGQSPGGNGGGWQEPGYPG
jgi:type VI secretion system secreted protein Hcp